MAFETTLGKWVAAQFNIRNAKKVVPTPNVTLERAYDKSRKLKRETHVQLLKELGPDWSERKVERWFRHKRNLAKMPAVRKFTETLWRFVFYVVIYVYGTVTLFEQPWFSNHDHCWTDYPLQAMPFSSKVYYFAELAFYLSLAMTLLWDNKRKDFTEQIVHHIATLLLLSLSYVCNFTRIGTLVMWAHDISDIFLESAKLCVYARKTTAADILFGLFACAFFLKSPCLLSPVDSGYIVESLNAFFFALLRLLCLQWSAFYSSNTPHHLVLAHRQNGAGHVARQGGGGHAQL